MSDSRNGTASIEDLLVKTSRTFALTIPLLPEPTRRQVGIAYLLFRIADTLEDSTDWTARRKVTELQRFRDLLDNPAPESCRCLGADWVADPPLRHDGYLELLGELEYVMASFGELPPSAQQPMRLHTQRTIDRMAAFVSRSEDDGTLQLDSLQDLQDYCYAVAGIVGEMLTELFLLGDDALAPVAGELREDASTFGEALQLVNILKDAAGDAVEGRSYLPRRVERTEVFDLARSDLETAGRYVSVLQRAGGRRGLVEFCALPVLLARATLDRVQTEGPGSKLTRQEVMEIVAALAKALDANRPAVPPL